MAARTSSFKVAEKTMADPGSEWAIWEPISVSEVTPLVNKLWCYPSIEKPPKKGYKLTVDEARISCKVNNSCYVAGVVGYVITDALVDAAVENARAIIDAAKPKRAKFCYEMMGWAIPDSPDSYLRLIRAVDREGFGVHLDLCNLVNSPIRFYRNAILLADCLDKLGPWIASCHAKDLTWDVEMNVHFREVPAGSGQMDYTAYLRGVAGLEHEAPFMIEHCANEAEYDKARTFILEHGRKIGVSFG